MGWLAAIPAVAGLIGDILTTKGAENQQNQYADFQNAQNKAAYQTWLPYANRNASLNAFLNSALGDLITSKSNPLTFEKGSGGSGSGGGSLARDLSGTWNPKTGVDTYGGVGGKTLQGLKNPITFPTSFPGGIYPGANTAGNIGAGLGAGSGSIAAIIQALKQSRQIAPQATASNGGGNSGIPSSFLGPDAGTGDPLNPAVGSESAGPPASSISSANPNPVSSAGNIDSAAQQENTIENSYDDSGMK